MIGQSHTTDADRVLEAITTTEHGRTRNELRDAFGRNWPASRLSDALDILLADRKIVEGEEATGGRPARRYRVTDERRAVADVSDVAALDGAKAECAAYARSALVPDPCRCERALPAADDGELRCARCGRRMAGS
jgi:hypothetical protein